VRAARAHEAVRGEPEHEPDAERARADRRRDVRDIRREFELDEPTHRRGLVAQVAVLGLAAGAPREREHVRCAKGGGA
jgi:hypothetical protein